VKDKDLVPFVEDAIFSPVYISLSKIRWLQLCELVSGSSIGLHVGFCATIMPFLLL
jgi:hypothetical protein